MKKCSFCFQSSVKTKDSQLRRAAETISRLKTQVQEAQLQLQGGHVGDKARVEALEARVKVLEKQRNELLEAFRKQMKLIDILKRQKVRLGVVVLGCCVIGLYW